MVKDNSFGIADLQDEMLDLLKTFIRMCEKNGLTYYACGGTCLGAVRHEGFIPWDDDLDVFMLRPDYEKLWDIYKDSNIDMKYKLCRTSYQKNYHHRVMQLVDMGTTFINKRSVDEDIEHGVYIDIIPIDARAKTKLGQIKQGIDCILFSVYNIQCLPEFNGGSIERLMTKLMLSLIRSPQKRYKIWHNAEKRMTSVDWNSATELIELTTAVKNLKQPYPKEWFGVPQIMKFEDTQINVPTEVYKYLKRGFGNYNELPPVEERHPRHNTVKIDLYKSYKYYKGIYYLKNGNKPE